MAPERLRMSVIVPAHDAAHVLPASLGALHEGRLAPPEVELVVVDDASGDGTGDVGERMADRVVRLEGSPHGPAYARNRGSEASSGDILVFVDADVCVHSDALERVRDRFEADAGISAVFGCYDTSPPEPGAVSQYRNLVHHYVHWRQPGDAETFWAGLGAVRRDAFDAVGGFDEVRYPRPQIEDIELGYRLRARGYRIVLDPSVRGTHLKRWTLGQVVRTDVRDRGVPWMRLLLERRARGAATLNVDKRERVFTALVVAGVGVAGVGAVFLHAPTLALGVAFVLAALVGNLSLLRWFASIRGLWFTITVVVPMRVLYYLLNGLSVLLALLGRAPRAAERVTP